MTLGSIHRAVLEIPERSGPLVDDQPGQALPATRQLARSAALRLADAGLVMRVTGASRPGAPAKCAKASRSRTVCISTSSRPGVVVTRKWCARMALGRASSTTNFCRKAHAGTCWPIPRAASSAWSAAPQSAPRPDIRRRCPSHGHRRWAFRRRQAQRQGSRRRPSSGSITGLARCLRAHKTSRIPEGDRPASELSCEP